MGCRFLHQSAVRDKVLETRLAPLFDNLWPSFDKKVSEIPKTQNPTKQNRPQHEILEELVSSIRGLDLRFRETVEVDSPRRSRRGRFHPMMLMEMAHEIRSGPNDPLPILVMASLLRDDAPWLYELAVEAHRAFADGHTAKARQARERFLSATRMLRRGPFLVEFSDKETHMLVHELEHFVHILEEAQGKTNKPTKDKEA